MSNQPPADMSAQEIRMFHGQLFALWQRIQGLPYAIRQAMGMQAEEQSSQDIGDSISAAYDTINAQIAAAMKRDDANTATQVSALKALKVTIPYHYSLGQKDENWLNDQINQIIGTPNVSDVKQANAIGNSVQSPPPSWEDTTEQENLTGEKPPQPQA